MGLTESCFVPFIHGMLNEKTNKFNSIKEARQSPLARQAMAIVEFADGRFGLSKLMAIPTTLQRKFQIVRVLPKNDSIRDSRIPRSSYSETVEGQADRRWANEDTSHVAARYRR